MKNILFILLFSIIVQSCSTLTNPRKEYAGDYKVKLKLGDDTFPEAAIKDTIKAGLAEAKEALKNVKIKIKDDINLENIDTTTTEGKIEYAAKAFGKGMAEFGLAMGEFGKSMGELAIGVANGSIDLADNIFNKIEFEISLLEDGSIKSENNTIDSFSFKDSTWEIEGKTFYLVDKDKNKEAFEIVGKKEDGFILKKDKVKIIFSKKSK